MSDPRALLGVSRPRFPYPASTRPTGWVMAGGFTSGSQADIVPSGGHRGGSCRCVAGVVQGVGRCSPRRRERWSSPDATTTTPAPTRRRRPPPPPARPRPTPPSRHDDDPRRPSRPRPPPRRRSRSPQPPRHPRPPHWTRRHWRNRSPRTTRRRITREEHVLAAPRSTSSRPRSSSSPRPAPNSMLSKAFIGRSRRDRRAACAERARLLIGHGGVSSWAVRPHTAALVTACLVTNRVTRGRDR